MSEESWERLFDRAAEHDASVAAVREAVAARRDARADEPGEADEESGGDGA